MFRTIRKRPAGQRQRAQSPSEEDEEDAPGHTGATTATELNKAAKRMRRGGAPSTGDKRDEVLPVVVAFGASGTAASLSSDMATRRLDVDGITEGDEASPKTQKDSSQILSGEEAERAAAAGEYQGLASYNQYVNTKKDHVKGIR